VDCSGHYPSVAFCVLIHSTLSKLRLFSTRTAPSVSRGYQQCNRQTQGSTPDSIRLLQYRSSLQTLHPPACIPSHPRVQQNRHRTPVPPQISVCALSANALARGRVGDGGKNKAESTASEPQPTPNRMAACYFPRLRTLDTCTAYLRKGHGQAQTCATTGAKGNIQGQASRPTMSHHVPGELGTYQCRSTHTCSVTLTGLARASAQSRRAVLSSAAIDSLACRKQVSGR